MKTGKFLAILTVASLAIASSANATLSINTGGGSPTLAVDADQPVNVSSGSRFNFSPSVPEPSTYIAGALLLLPFGVSTLRSLRRKA